MGTSASSSGPGGGVPLVPPWVPEPGTDGGPAEGAPIPDASKPVVTPQLAPPARFRDARRQLGQFSRNGDGIKLRNGLGEYVRRGLGGSNGATRRMGGALARSGALHGVLQSLAAGTLQPSELGFDAAHLASRPVREIIDRIARLVSPADGTQDAESSQKAVNTALSDLLDNESEADVTALTPTQIDWVLERHIVCEIHQRVQLDVGKSILDHAPSPSAAADRINEMRGYIQETVAAAFREQKRTAGVPDRAGTARLMAEVVRRTFSVFEEFLQ